MLNFYNGVYLFINAINISAKGYSLFIRFITTNKIGWRKTRNMAKKDKPPSANKNKNLINTGKNYTFRIALQY